MAYLVQRPEVKRVNHPSLPDHPDHETYRSLFSHGGASIFTFEIRGGKEDAWRFIDNLQLFSLLAKVADVKSLAIHPASTTHSQLSEEELREAAITPSTIRLSIGTEHIDDIIADLDQAFESLKKQLGLRSPHGDSSSLTGCNDAREGGGEMSTEAQKRESVAKYQREKMRQINIKFSPNEARSPRISAIA